MERKIGEIFEYNGEWYQAIDNKHGVMCSGCVFVNECNECIADRNIVGSCECEADNKLIFKKLEKVGEPVTVKGRTFQKLTSDNCSCKECVFNVPNKACYKNRYIEGICDGNGFWVEIKQTKEDMEEKKKELDDLVGLYSSGQIDYKEFDKELRALYSDKEEIKSILKPFDFEAAKSGKPVCTRDGRKARIICFDRKGYNLFPIVALIMDGDQESYMYTYRSNGTWDNSGNVSDNDLMMLPEKRSGWINVKKDAGLFKSKEEAERNCTKDYATVRVEFEI